MKMLLFPNQYLIIPIDEDLYNFDRFLLKAIEAVAKSNGFKKGKKYLKSKLGCSGNSVKNMTKIREYSKILDSAKKTTKTETSTKTLDWDPQEYKTKDAYRYIRKIDKNKYAEAIKLIITEYSQIATEEERKDIVQSLEKYNVDSLTYQWGLCYKSLDGLNTVISDPKTANKVNRIETADTVAIKIQDELLMNETEVIL